LVSYAATHSGSYSVSVLLAVVCLTTAPPLLFGQITICLAKGLLFRLREHNAAALAMKMLLPAAR
jgi:hypothetical protein